MCVVSNVGDKWNNPDWWPEWPQQTPWPKPKPIIDSQTSLIIEAVQLRKQLADANAEIDKLRKTCEKMKEELEAAKQQDIDDGNPDCEMEAKVAVIKLLAEVFKVDVSKVFP